jgi:hypothetical protein
MKLKSTKLQEQSMEGLVKTQDILSSRGFDFFFVLKKEVERRHSQGSFMGIK